MASKKVYVDHLSKVEMFQHFSRKHLERVASSGDHITVPAGKILFQQDQTGSDAYIVLSGEVTISRNGKAVATLGEGQLLGELSLLDQGPRTATATCATECDVLVISRPRFMALVDDVPELQRPLFASLANRLRNLDRTAFG
jgi:CRP/FNR family transcriptional regulator, cyclic AMP receptor protein